MQTSRLFHLGVMALISAGISPAKGAAPLEEFFSRSRVEFWIQDPLPPGLPPEILELVDLVDLKTPWFGNPDSEAPVVLIAIGNGEATGPVVLESLAGVTPNLMYAVEIGPTEGTEQTLSVLATVFTDPLPY